MLLTTSRRLALKTKNKLFRVLLYTTSSCIKINLMPQEQANFLIQQKRSLFKSLAYCTGMGLTKTGLFSVFIY